MLTLTSLICLADPHKVYCGTVVSCRPVGSSSSNTTIVFKVHFPPQHDDPDEDSHELNFNDLKTGALLYKSYIEEINGIKKVEY